MKITNCENCGAPLEFKCSHCSTPYLPPSELGLIAESKRLETVVTGLKRTAKDLSVRLGTLKENYLNAQEALDASDDGFGVGLITAILALGLISFIVFVIFDYTMVTRSRLTDLQNQSSVETILEVSVDREVEVIKEVPIWSPDEFSQYPFAILNRVSFSPNRGGADFGIFWPDGSDTTNAEASTYLEDGTSVRLLYCFSHDSEYFATVYFERTAYLINNLKTYKSTLSAGEYQDIRLIFIVYQAELLNPSDACKIANDLDWRNNPLPYRNQQ